jgi:mRNA-degrading endonuclease RelE of RelBE toxin-antitoxin system
MRLIFTDEFKHDIRKIKDLSCQVKIKKNITKIMLNPGTGKPLKYELAGLLSLRLAKSRLIYEVRNDTIILHKFEHRKSVYKPS